MSVKNKRCIEQIREFSEQSIMNNKHGAGIFKGHRLICKAINNNRSAINNSIMCSLHAENNCIHLLINTYFKTFNMSNEKIRRKMKKFKIITCRNDLKHGSKPCFDCINQIKIIGIKNIIYVENNIIYSTNILGMDNRRSPMNTQNKHIKIRYH